MFAYRKPQPRAYMPCKFRLIPFCSRLLFSYFIVVGCDYVSYLFICILTYIIVLLFTFSPLTSPVVVLPLIFPLLAFDTLLIFDASSSNRH